MELTEKSGSVLTIAPGVGENTSSRLNIVDCANGKNDRASSKQNGHSASNAAGGGGGGSHVSSDHPTSYGETLMHLLRGNIGAGVFGMGDAFKNGGLFLAPVLTIIIGAISVHCQHVLINCARRMRDIQSQPAEKAVNNNINEDPDFAETVELCFANGPPRLRSWSKFVKFLVNLFICVTQMGFCCIYFVFIATNFKQIWDIYVSYEFDIYVRICLILLPILLVSLITNLKYLVPFSTIANISMASGITLTLYYAFQGLPAITDRRFVGEWNDLPLFFGTAIFAYEGIALVLPLKNVMKKPAQFDRTFGVLNTGMIFISMLFITCGFFGYWKWGEGVLGSLTLNLNPKEPLAQTIKVMVSLGILLSYPLQFFVGIQIMWASIEQKQGPLEYPLTTQLLFRVFMVLVTFVVSEMVPKLNLFLSLIGALCSSALALVFPPVIELVCAWSTSSGPSAIMLSKNCIIMVVAVFGLITGTYESINALVTDFRRDH